MWPVLRKTLSYLALAAGLLSAGCSDAPPPDEAAADGGPVDLGLADVMRHDSGPGPGPSDAGPFMDASPTDAASADGGTVTDSGPADVGAPKPDAGPPDAMVPDTGPTPYCTNPADCDDNSACTLDSCVDGVCVHESSTECTWPAERTRDATNLTSVGGSAINNAFSSDLSGALWNPVHRTLWLCRNNGPSAVWALEEDGAGGYRFATRGGQPAEWTDFGDAEAVAQADFNDDNTVYVLSEREGAIVEYDLSVGGTKVQRNHWDLSAQLTGSGAEGMTFVPDTFLAAQGFVDGSGTPYTSTSGMNGLMFVGHQARGQVFAYDLDRSTGAHIFVGVYETGAAETAGLEFDRSTGQLFLWHDADFDQLEVTHLSSTPTATGRKLDTLVTYEGPTPLSFMSTNIEGVAIKPIEDCSAGRRDLFLTIDGGRVWSLFLYLNFPC